MWLQAPKLMFLNHPETMRHCTDLQVEHQYQRSILAEQILHWDRNQGGQDEELYQSELNKSLSDIIER